MLRERGVSPIYNMPLQSLANTKLVRSPTLKGRKRAITDNDITSLGGGFKRRSDWFSVLLGPIIRTVFSVLVMRAHSTWSRVGPMVGASGAAVRCCRLLQEEKNLEDNEIGFGD